VTLSTISRLDSRMPVTSSASTSSRISGASIGSVVNAQTVSWLADGGACCACSEGVFWLVRCSTYVSGGGVGFEAEQSREGVLFGAGFGDHAACSGPAAVALVDEHGFLDPVEGVGDRKVVRPAQHE